MRSVKNSKIQLQVSKRILKTKINLKIWQKLTVSHKDCVSKVITNLLIYYVNLILNSDLVKSNGTKGEKKHIINSFL